MNAKELIEAAKAIKDGTCDGDVKDAFLNHILATVREDDDEPVTRERLEADGWAYSNFCDEFYHKDVVRTSTDRVISVDQQDEVWVFHYPPSQITIKSMGHLRRLVAALGDK